VIAPRVVVLDYGSGNIHSAAQALEVAGARVELTRDFDSALAADGLLVPGVGAFTAVMEQLDLVRGGDIVDQRLVRDRPVMGICVGMQVMFARGVEHGHDTEGLGQWPGVVDQLTNAPRLPHIGWNTLDAAEDSVLFEGIADERFYFVHSYGVREWELVAGPLASPLVTWAEYGDRFIAAVENGPLVATQFHPEKSGEAGIQLLRNWLASL
jgi:imidazole glycerol-phosphate synthase subunit HisH